MAEQGNMICPACEKFQPRADECAHCGVIIAKAGKPPPTTQTPKAEPESSGLPVKAMLAVAVVVVGAGLFMFIGDSTDSEELIPEKKRSFSQIDRIAIFKPKIASKIQVTNAKVTLQRLKTRLYMLGVEGEGEPPSTEEGLQILVTRGYLTKEEITDPWGREFAYRLEWGTETQLSGQYKIYVHSLGADGVSNTSDDIGMP